MVSPGPFPPAAYPSRRKTQLRRELTSLSQILCRPRCPSPVPAKHRHACKLRHPWPVGHCKWNLGMRSATVTLHMLRMDGITHLALYPRPISLRPALPVQPKSLSAHRTRTICAGHIRLSHQNLHISLLTLSSGELPREAPAPSSTPYRHPPGPTHPTEVVTNLHLHGPARPLACPHRILLAPTRTHRRSRRYA